MNNDREMIPGGGPVSAVPLELRSLPQWVGWRLVDRDGKATKVPVDPKTGGFASSTDPKTWASFEVAFAGALDGRWDGVGFTFSKDDPYCGIDLDEAIDPETGEIDPDAAAVVDRFETYTELSPSRTGLHLILRGSPPGGVGRKRADRECYDRGRFFTFTALVASPHGVEDRQSCLTTWHAETFPVAVERKPMSQVERPPLDVTDDELLNKIRNSKQGAKFSRLWVGDTTGYSSGSEADLALCSILAFWCNGDPDRVDRLFRSSDLYRPKWDAARGQATYGTRTVERAVRTTSAGYDPNYRSKNDPTPVVGSVIPQPAGEYERRFRWASELSAPPKSDDWLWEGYLPRSGITLLSALWKAGKTTLLSHLLKACATDGLFLGQKMRGCRVLYVTEEGEKHWVRRRDALSIADHVGFYLQPFATKPVSADWLGFVGQLRRDIETHGFDLVVFDTLAKLWPVVEENDAGSVDAALMPLWELTKAGAGVLLIHHLRKGGGQEYTGSRGSGALSAFPDIIVELTRFDASDAKCKKRVLKAKGRYDETPDELVIEMVDGAYVHVPDLPTDPIPTLGVHASPVDDPKSEEERIVHILVQAGKPLTSGEIEAALTERKWGIRQVDVATHLSSLANRSQVVVSGKLQSKTNPRKFSLASLSAPGSHAERDGGKEINSEERVYLPPSLSHETQGRIEME